MAVFGGLFFIRLLNAGGMNIVGLIGAVIGGVLFTIGQVQRR
ncbi:hypothetical protein [Halalkalibacter nanhaiisediminis]|nr:hypothetical protein [Halalkalibacter nanhaiisediminis]